MSRLQIWRVVTKGVVTVLLLLWAGATFAASPSLLLETEFFPDRQTKIVEVRYTLTNEGTARAEDVRISLRDPTASESLITTLAPGESQRIKREYPFSDFNLNLPGMYHVPYYLMYRDEARKTFSEFRLMTIRFLPLSAKALEIFFDTVEPDSTILVQDELELDVSVRSVAPYHLAVTSLRPAVPEGISITAPEIRLPAPLAPQELLRQKFKLHQIADKTPGTVYYGWLIVEGEALGRHFSEVVRFGVHYPPPKKSWLVLYVLVFIIVVCLVVLFARLYWRAQMRSARHRFISAGRSPANIPPIVASRPGGPSRLTGVDDGFKRPKTNDIK